MRKIAKAFRTEQAACPSWWLHTRNEKDYSWRFENSENKYEWAPCVIRGIIGNPIYLGHSVMCKTEMIFKVGKYRNVPESEQIQVDNTHEPLVSQELLTGQTLRLKAEGVTRKMILFTMLILGFLVTGIFSNEFSWKADAIFFTVAYRRSSAPM